MSLWVYQKYYLTLFSFNITIFKVKTLLRELRYQVRKFENWVRKMSGKFRSRERNLQTFQSGARIQCIISNFNSVLLLGWEILHPVCGILLDFRQEMGILFCKQGQHNKHQHEDPSSCVILGMNLHYSALYIDYIYTKSTLHVIF